MDTVLEHLNGISPSIAFTVEQGSDGKLHFLDALVTQEEDGTLEVGV